MYKLYSYNNYLITIINILNLFKKFIKFFFVLILYLKEKFCIKLNCLKI